MEEWTYGVVLKGGENNNLFCSLESKNKSRELKRAVERLVLMLRKWDV